MTNRLWQQCINHCGTDVEQFIETYFSDDTRHVLLLGGAGFDPRSHHVTEKLAAVCSERLTGVFLREERPNPTGQLVALAAANEARIRNLITNVQIHELQVFDIDNAPVGGRRAATLLAKTLNLSTVTDIVLDCSALSIGVMFPIARFCLDAVRRKGPDMNFHIVMLDDPKADSAVESTSCGKASPLHTFNGGLDLDSTTDAARLWLPQLGTGRREVLHLIYQHVQPHAVCPIIPFPSTNPRQGDALIEEYGDLFDAIGAPMTPTWNVDSRDIVYAHEKSPLDLYRSVLNIDDARRRVFDQTGGSQLILSPLGSKAVSVGLLMAALERGFAVVSVESIEYRLKSQLQPFTTDESAEFVHIWLHGTAYHYDDTPKDAYP